MTLMERFGLFYRMNNIAIELEALERVFSDASAEPIKLSYRLLGFITDNFSIEIGHGGFGVVYMVWFVLLCLPIVFVSLICPIGAKCSCSC